MTATRLALAILGFLACVGATVLALAVDEPESSLSPEGFVAVEATQRGLEVRRAVATAQRFEGNPHETLVLVLHADRPYSSSDLDAYRSFLERGGAVLVADSVGYGTQVGNVVGIAFERVRLFEPSSGFSAELAGREVTAVSQNATALKVAPGADAEVLGSTSPSSFVDRDGNGRIDAADPPGPFPFLATGTLGGGRLWALSIPDVFAGDAGHVGNAEFRDALLDELAAGRTQLIVDETRADTPSPFVAAIRHSLRAGTVPWSQAALVAAGLVGAGAIWTIAPLRPWTGHHYDPRRFLYGGDLEGSGAAVASGWTVRGSLSLALALVLAAGGLAFGSPAAAWAAACLAGVLAGAWAMAPPRGSAQRTLSATRLQEEATANVELHVRLQGPLRGVELQDDLEATVEVPAGKTTTSPASRAFTWSYEVRPSRLGLVAIGPLLAQRKDGFGLRVARQRLAPSDQVKVTPRLENARRTPFKSRVPQLLLGGHVVQRAGSGSEFLSLRDYQVGDAMRMVNWKASARSKTLIVNQRVHESQTELSVFLDARAASDVGPASATPFVLGCRAAASIAAGAMRSRDRVRFVLYGSAINEVNGKGTEQQRALEDHLAGAKAAGDLCLRDALEPFLTKLKAGRPVVVITGGDGDPTVASALQMLRHRGARPFLVCPKVWAREGQAGDRGVQDRAQLVADARGAGISTYEALEGLPLEDLFRIQGGR